MKTKPWSVQRGAWSVLAGGVLLGSACLLPTARAQSLGDAFADRSALSAPRSANPDADATLVVFNPNDPDSEDLARFYAEKRGIPKAQVLGIACATTEEITREEYNTRIAEPLRKAFTANFLWKLRDPDSPLGPVESSRIRFVVLMRGMPLKIAPAPNLPREKVGGPAVIADRNEASVDSELAVLALSKSTPFGALNNPYYRSFTPSADARRPELLLVCRLDGPSAVVVRRMITDSLATEQKGLRGFAYIDARGLGTKEGLGEGDEWLFKVATQAQRRGMPVIFDNTDALFPTAYPMSHAALYFGWYAEAATGPFTRKEWSFPTGAVACHIHSFSGVTVRDPGQNWVGPLLAAGAAATMGNVYEPYLDLTPHLDVFHERLRAGFTFAESAYMSQKVLSWMTTFVGDPLYRPFPTTPAVPPAANDEWEAYRRGAVRWEEDRAASEAALRDAGKKLRSGVVWEGLALLQLRASAQPAALASFEEARKAYRNANDILRVAIHEVILLKAMNRPADAVAVAQKQITAFPQLSGAEVLRMLVAPPPPPPPVPPPAPVR